MIISEPICILTAGTSVHGHDISQHIIDEMAESYDPKKYTARIFKDGEQRYGNALGSVISLEKRGKQLFAVLKPNSQLLETIEQGQLLHSGCEYIKEFAGTDKAYLTGLYLTDNPSSLGTTQIHLSVSSKGSEIKKGIFHKKDDSITELRTQICKLTTQMEKLTDKAKELTDEPYL